MNVFKYFLGYRSVVLLLLLLLAACAPDDLDITPTATSTPEPTATPTATPVPEDFVDPNLDNQRVLDTILAEIPASIPAGAVQWRRDLTRAEDGVETITRAENGVGARVFYTEQTGGQMNLTFAVFDTVEDAATHYAFIQSIRQPLETGNENDTFPTPNIFGSGLYGSVAIFQIDTVFIEVNIELFSSTQSNPLVPLARATLDFYEELEFDFDSSSAASDVEAASSADTDTASVGHPLMDAVLVNLPGQIMGDAIWTRDFERFDGLQIPDSFDNGTVIRVFYREQTGGALQLTYGVFDTVEDAVAQYDRFKGIRDGLGEENSNEDFPQPHIFGQGLYGSVALFQIDDVFIEVLIERAPGTVANPLLSISRTALQTLEDAQASLNS